MGELKMTHKDYNFQEKLQDAVLKQLGENREPNPYRASSCGKCTRCLGYMKIKAEPKNDDWRGLLTLSLGQMIENQVCDILEKEGLITSRQLEVEHALPSGTVLSGHIDGLWVDPLCIIDCKSSAYMSYADVRKRGVEAIDESYKAQAHLYMKALGMPFYFLYYKKDTSHTMFIELPFDNAIYNRIDIRYRQLALVKDNDTLPPRDYLPLKSGNLAWQCSYCKYTSLCYPDFELSFVDGKPKYSKNEDEKPKEDIMTKEELNLLICNKRIK
jgi:hypothetical protein